MENLKPISARNEFNRRQRSGRWKMLFVFLVCASPLIFSYLTYYVFKPEGRTNYGTILDPRNYPIPVLDSRAPDGSPLDLGAFKGKWIMLQVGGSDCPAACQKKLLDMRQLRLAQGKEMNRIERVWLVTDSKPADPVLLHEIEGTRLLQVDPGKAAEWLPAEPGAGMADHIYLIDPLGNLMMRFPKDADPNKVKRDLGKLLKASSIG